MSVPARLFGLRDESGSSLVEFSLSAVVLLMAVAGVMDFSRALYIDHFLANAASEATRYAMVRGATFAGNPCSTASTASCDATAANVTSYVTSLSPTGINTANMTVNTTWPGTSPTGSSCVSAVSSKNSPGCVVNVTITYSFNFAVPILPANTLVLTGSSAVAIAE